MTDPVEWTASAVSYLLGMVIVVGTLWPTPIPKPTNAVEARSAADAIAHRRHLGYVAAGVLVADAIYTALNYRTAIGPHTPIAVELFVYAGGGVLLGLFITWARASYHREAALRDTARAQHLAKHL